MRVRALPSLQPIASTLIAALTILGSACSDGDHPVGAEDRSIQLAARSTATGGNAQVAALVESINARLAAGGSTMRIGAVWMFTIGPGVDPFRTLRTGFRWQESGLTWMQDVSDYTGDVTFAEVDAALQSAYETWDGVGKTTIALTRAADDGANHDLLDAIVLDGSGDCIDIVDTTSPDLVSYNPATGAIDFNPFADIVVGGWLTPAYFQNCLGSANIIAVTWSFFDTADSNSDNYADLVYVEQFYNTFFEWTTTDAVYLDFSAPFDLETIALHEDGHALGLGHFGGPNARQPFKLQPNGKVFDPTASMNPFYLGGELREPQPTDVAGLRTLYGRRGN